MISFCLYFVPESDKEKALAWLEPNFCLHKKGTQHDGDRARKDIRRRQGMEYIRKQLQIPMEKLLCDRGQHE